MVKMVSDHLQSARFVPRPLPGTNKKWSCPGPLAGAQTGEEDGDGELLLALESEAEGLTRRRTIRFWGLERVAEEYYDGSWMHTRVKRRRARAKAILKQYRDMATGR